MTVSWTRYRHPLLTFKRRRDDDPTPVGSVPELVVEEVPVPEKKPRPVKAQGASKKAAATPKKAASVPKKSTTKSIPNPNNKGDKS